MKKRTLAALLGTLTALSSVAPTMAQAAENTEEYTVTFCRTQDSTMESDIFSILKDESYEDNRWTRLIADRLGSICGLHRMKSSRHRSLMQPLQQERYQISFVSIN